eukprot:6230611-Pyramimonas_sp.AAC.1
MSFEPKSVLITRTVFLEHKPDVLKQDSLGHTCSKNMSRRPREVLGTLFGGPVGEPGRRLANA